MTKNLQSVMAGAIAAIGIGLASASGFAAAQTPQQVVQFRKGSMQVQNWHSRVLVQMIKGARPFDAAVYLRSAIALDAMAATTPEGFAAGSEVGETRATPAIWKDAAGFKSAVDRFQSDTSKMVMAARAGDEKTMRAQVGEMVQTCNACHDKFRSK